MRHAVAVTTTLIALLVLDIIVIQIGLQPLFQAQVGQLLAPVPKVWAAGLFYLTYVFAVTWLVVLPALSRSSPRKAAVDGAVLGAAAYGTFEFTNMALLAGWSPVLVVFDVLWGTLLTAVCAAAGVAAALRVGN